MPRLNPTTLTQVVDTLWENAQHNFRTAGFVYPHLIGLNPDARNTIFVQEPATSPVAQRPGHVAVPGPWTDHLDLIRDTMTTNGIVAAILIAEAWVTRNQAAIDTMTMNIPVHEHPMKDEMVLVVGSYPKAGIPAYGHSAIVTRDDQGNNATLSTPIPITSNDSTLVGTWLTDLLKSQ